LPEKESKRHQRLVTVAVAFSYSGSIEGPSNRIDHISGLDLFPVDGTEQHVSPPELSDFALAYCGVTGVGVTRDGKLQTFFLSLRQRSHFSMSSFPLGFLLLGLSWVIRDDSQSSSWMLTVADDDPSCKGMSMLKPRDEICSLLMRIVSAWGSD